jgi:hypothetical protein
MKRFVAIAGFFSIASLFAPPSFAQMPMTGPTITVVGCTRPGVERSCVILSPLTPGPSYSLHSSSAVPAFGRAAAVTGTVGGFDFCMQGGVMNVTSWHYVKGGKARCLLTGGR